MWLGCSILISYFWLICWKMQLFPFLKVFFIIFDSLLESLKWFIWFLIVFSVCSVGESQRRDFWFVSGVAWQQWCAAASSGSARHVVVWHDTSSGGWCWQNSSGWAYNQQLAAWHRSWSQVWKLVLKEINTLGSRQNGWHFADNIFIFISLCDILCILIQIPLKFISQVSN